MARLEVADNSVTVRMYRQGHGDCFLLAFPRMGGGDPVYALIDCGYKPGSQNFVHGTKIADIVDHIKKSTGEKLDLAIVTHEHQDHVNGIWKKNDPYFEGFTIEEAWLAWTESPTDPDAITLRERHRDQLLGLVEARHQLALAVGDDNETVARLDGLLALEFGDEQEGFDRARMILAASDPNQSTNKQGLKLIKDRAREHRGVDYLDPGMSRVVPGTDGVRAYVLGPPKDPNLLADEDPVGEEGFSGGGSHRMSFGAGARAAAGEYQPMFPFRRKFRLEPGPASIHPFFAAHYGPEQAVPDPDPVDGEEVPEDAAWRRIDEEWLYSAESLALKLNRGINNTSLVLAFELPRSEKVLLFVGDAQRGNWISWADCEWEDGDFDKTRNLLSRTVLYKVGHHGSHNATLKGAEEDDYANLSWMGHGRYASEFTAMINAVTEWAMTKNRPPWRHPLPAIRRALEEKTEGRIFQTDEDTPQQPAGMSNEEWQRFTERMDCTKDYFDYIIVDGFERPEEPVGGRSHRRQKTKAKRAVRGRKTKGKKTKARKTKAKMSTAKRRTTKKRQSNARKKTPAKDAAKRKTGRTKKKS